MLDTVIAEAAEGTGDSESHLSKLLKFLTCCLRVSPFVKPLVIINTEQISSESPSTLRMSTRSYQDAMVHLNSLQSTAATLENVQATRAASGEFDFISRTLKFLERIGYTVSVCRCQCTAVSQLHSISLNN